MTEYLTVYKGREQRKPRPLTDNEESAIKILAENGEDADLMEMLLRWQNDPRKQRLIQEAIERKRRG